MAAQTWTFFSIRPSTILVTFAGVIESIWMRMGILQSESNLADIYILFIVHIGLHYKKIFFSENTTKLVKNIFLSEVQ